MTNKEIDTDCGKRVRIAITSCGMKLPAFGKKYKISFSHLYAIEKGERPLNQKTAERIASGVRQEGYLCSIDWLLKGKGFPPIKEDVEMDEMEERDSILAVLSPELKIMKEASFFQQLHKKSIVSCVLDNGMAPVYTMGDYVGGVYSEDPKGAIGKDCIIITEEGEQHVRRVFKGTQPGCYTLTCMNPFIKKVPPILFDQLIQWVAPIIWHRRRNY